MLHHITCYEKPSAIRLEWEILALEPVNSLREFEYVGESSDYTN